MADRDDPPPGPMVEFRLLGPFSVREAGLPLVATPTGPAQHLLIYLLLHAEKAHRREALAEVVWPEEATPSRAAFNTALWRLRRFLDRLPGAVALDVTASTLRLRVQGQGRVDVAELTEAAHPLPDPGITPSPEALDGLRRAVGRWRGPFAEGLTQDWALVARERVLNLYLRALTTLMRSAGQARQFEQALDYGQAILAEDPFRESVHCEVMWLMVLTGRRAQALRDHAAFRRLLEAELGIAPMAETQALHDYIRGGMDQGPRLAASLAQPGVAGRGALQYRAYVDAIGESRASVYDALIAGNPIP